MKEKLVKQRKCPICGRNTLRLASHIRLAHPGESNETAEAHKGTSYKNDVIVHNTDAFTKDDLLQSSRKAITDITTVSDMNDNNTIYQCNVCHTKVNKGMAQCPSCRSSLLWGDL